MKKARKVALFSLAFLTAIGCQKEEDKGSEETYREVIRQQAEQTRVVQEQNRQTTEAARRLVEADAEARKQTLEHHAKLQEGLQAERVRLDEYRDDVEQERRVVAANRYRDPIVALAIENVALLIAGSLPIVFCILMVLSLRHDHADQDLQEILVTEIVTESPMFLPAVQAPAITASEAPAALPAAEDEVNTQKEKESNENNRNHRRSCRRDKGRDEGLRR